MKAFSFPLESLLKFRDLKVKVLQGELASLVLDEEELKKLESELKHENDQLGNCMQEMRQKGNLRDQHDSLTYSTYLESQLRKIHEELTAQQKNIFSKQQDLLKALKERKIVEKLKEKHYSRWQQKTSEES